VYFVPGASDSVAVLRFTPCVMQPPPFGLFTVVEVEVLPTNAVPLVNLPEIVLVVTEEYVTASFAPVDVVPLFHLTDRLAVPGFVYARTCAQFSFAGSLSRKVSSPLVIPDVPVQSESVPFAVRVWATLTVADTGGDNVSVPANFVHVNTVDPPAGDVVADEADVVDPAGAVGGAELLDEELLEHAGRNAAIAITVAAVTTRRLRTRVTSVSAKMGDAPYIARQLRARQRRRRGRDMAATCGEKTKPARSSFAIRTRCPLFLRGQRAGVRHASRSPCFELPLGAYRFDLYPQPPVHGPPAHLEGTNMRSARQLSRLARLHAHQESALATRAHCHVAVDEERETAEHPLLGQAALGREEITHTVGKVFVERHTPSVAAAQTS
jgi:hypothetical protein